ncbi:MAG TPA: HlyD family efflux transporter periplasmic adaptor subunit [Bryobacteraceae bacterium]|nr:HlyD family efflux transporter periplasmic adaptor subunit [Bryobacteraceae bacterium]
MNPRRVLAIVIVVLAVLAAGGLAAWQYRAAAVKPAAAPPAAQVPADISVPAVLRAANTTLVAVPIDGKVVSFEVEPGAEVYTGQLLARIRNEGLESTREAAEADLENAETRVRNLESTLTAARLEASRASADAARLRNDLERATKQYQRQKMMIEQGATPRKVFEKAEADFKAADSESKSMDAVAQAAEERITTLSRDLDAARKLLESKAQDLEEAKERVGAGDVVSPVDGIVVARRGQAGDQVSPTTVDLFEIATNLSALHAVAEVAPAFAAKVTPGVDVKLVIAELGGETLTGKVSKVEGGAITAEFANPNPAVKPGLTAQMRIKLP